MFSCREKNTQQILELLREEGAPLTLRAIGARVHRGVAYVRSLCEESDAIEFLNGPLDRARMLVSDWQVALTPPRDRF